MTEEERERPYPLKSLHDFLFELDREWGKFRIGSLIGVIVSGVLLVSLIFRVLVAAFKHQVVNFVFSIIITAVLVYSVYTLFVQYKFFSKWERRIGLLLHLEEKLMSERLEEKPSR